MLGSSAPDPSLLLTSPIPLANHLLHSFFIGSHQRLFLSADRKLHGPSSLNQMLSLYIRTRNNTLGVLMDRTVPRVKSTKKQKKNLPCSKATLIEAGSTMLRQSWGGLCGGRSAVTPQKMRLALL